MYSTLSYLTRKASFKQVNDHMPITQSIPNAEEPEVFAGQSCSSSSAFPLAVAVVMQEQPFSSARARRSSLFLLFWDSHADPLLACITANQRELVSDFLRKAKQLEYLITSLPSSTSSAEQEDEAEFEDLEKEMKEVNGEYEEALKVAGEFCFCLGGREKRSPSLSADPDLIEQRDCARRSNLPFDKRWTLGPSLLLHLEPRLSPFLAPLLRRSTV
jgi:hypothetical protein